MKKLYTFLFLVVGVLCHAQTDSTAVKNQPVGQITYKMATRDIMGEPNGFSYIFLAFDSIASFQVSDRYGMGKDEGNRAASDGKSVAMVSSQYDEKGFQVYRNLKTHEVIFRSKKRGPEPAHTVKENWIDIPWKLHNKFKTIAGYNAQKATCTLRGRNWIAWFTKDIPYPYGPMLLHGLPGIILEAESGYLFYTTHEVCYPCEPDKTEKIIVPYEERSYTIKEYVYRNDNSGIFNTLEFQKKGITNFLTSSPYTEKEIWERRQWHSDILYEWETKDTKRALTNKDTLKATVNYEASKQNVAERREAMQLGRPKGGPKNPPADKDDSLPIYINSTRNGKD